MRSLSPVSRLLSHAGSTRVPLRRRLDRALEVE